MLRRQNEVSPVGSSSPALPPRQPKPLRVVEEDGEPLRIASNIERLREIAAEDAQQGGVVRLEPERVKGFTREQAVAGAEFAKEGPEGPQADAAGSEWGERSATHAAWWLCAAVGVVAVVLILAVCALQWLSEFTPDVNPIGMSTLHIEPRTVDAREERIADLLGRKEEARVLFSRFLGATSSEELRGLCRAASEGETGMPVPLPRAAGSSVPAVPAHAKWQVHTDMDPVYGVLSGYFADDTPFQAFFVLEHGRLRLDWKATTGYSTAPFSQLVAGTGDGSEIRVWVEPSFYYSTVFPESAYHCYRFYRMIDDPACWGYVSRGSDAEKTLRRIFPKGGIVATTTKPKMVILKLNRPSDGAQPNQWSITDVLHSEWIVP
jgi:hypothetical protein